MSVTPDGSCALAGQCNQPEILTRDMIAMEEIAGSYVLTGAAVGGRDDGPRRILLTD